MTQLRWCEDKTRLNNPSPAESRIINCLKGSNAKFYREVKFQGCESAKGYQLFYDFYIPERKILIEYDGPHHLTNEDINANDKIKNKFAKDNGLYLRRLDRREWVYLEKIINKLAGKAPTTKSIEKKQSPPINNTSYKPTKVSIQKKHEVKFRKILKAYKSL